MEEVIVSGARIPSLGLGTYRMQGETCRRAVAHALAVGYRHVDTAGDYDNETAVGEGIRDSGVPRDELCVTTKVWREHLSPANVNKSARLSLKHLALDYLDLLLVHWPNPAIPLAETLGAMQDLQERGLVRHIGVSNFTPALMEEALSLAPVVCNQVEYHPYLEQRALLQIARDSDTALIAYAPIARGIVALDPVIVAIARAHGKTPVQVVLRWLTSQRNVAAIPKAASAAHIDENLASLDFELTEEDKVRMARLERGERLVNPPWSPRWGEAPPDELMSRRRRHLAPDTPWAMQSQITVPTDIHR